MPSNIVKSVADRCDMSTSEVEEIWNDAKKEAEKQGEEENYKYIMGIFKSMIGDDCAKKMDWKNEGINRTDKLLEKIENYLYE